MKNFWLVCAALGSVGPAAANAAPSVHLEFLWQARDRALDARPQALGLIARPPQPHQLCWKAQNFPVPAAATRLRVFDDAGVEVINEQRRHESVSPTPVVCRDLMLDIEDAHYGNWRFDFYLNDQLAGSEQIEVSESLEGAGFYRHTDRPYVVGRTNYPKGVPAHDYHGHVLWQLTIAADGSVADVATLEAEGIAVALRERADQAARLFRFPPDPARRDEPLVVNQPYIFAAAAVKR